MDNKGNENDQKFLRAGEIFLQLKEAGLGYFAENEGKLYCCPNPVIQLNERLQYHSETKPALYWSEDLKLYYLFGVHCEKDLWKKIVSKSLSFKEVMAISNIEQRMVALKYLGAENLLSEKMIVDSIKGYALYEVKGIFPRTQYFLRYTCPSTGREYLSGIDPEVGRFKSATKALEWKFYLEGGETFDYQS